MLGIVLGVSLRGTLTNVVLITLCALLIIGLCVILFLIFKQKHTAVITTLLVGVATIYTSVYCNYLAQTTPVQLHPSHNYYYTGIINKLYDSFL